MCDLNENPSVKAYPSAFNILLLGETGSGKSTLINYLTNYILGGSLDNLKIKIATKYHHVTEERTNYFPGGSLENLKVKTPTKYHQATEERTNYFHGESLENHKIKFPIKYHQAIEKIIQDKAKSEIEECTLYDFTKKSFHFNFIDTPGLSDSDNSDNTDKISKIMAAVENAENLAAIILVVNGTLARDTKNLRKAIMLLKGSIPDVLLNNLIVVHTNCTANTANFVLRQLGSWVVPEENVFYMNNSALSKPMSDWINDEDKKIDLQWHWNKSFQEIKKMMIRINQLGRIVSDAFGEMRKRQNEVMAQLYKLLLELKTIQELLCTLCNLQLNETDIPSKTQIYSIFKLETQVKIYDTAFYKPVERIQTVQMIMQEMESNFNKHIENKVNIEAKISNLHEDIHTLKQSLDVQVQKVQDCLGNLQQDCSQFNIVDELTNKIDAMKINANGLTNMEKRADAEERIKNMQGFIDYLHKAERLCHSVLPGSNSLN